MTNREWLESLSDEELASAIEKIMRCDPIKDGCVGCLLIDYDYCLCDSKETLTDWLKAERSESE